MPARPYTKPSERYLSSVIASGVIDPAFLTDLQSWSKSEKEEFHSEFEKVREKEFQARRRINAGVRAELDHDGGKRIPVLENIASGISDAAVEGASLLARIQGAVGGGEERHELADYMNRAVDNREQVRSVIDTRDNFPDILQSGTRGAARSIAQATALASTGGGSAAVIGGFAASRGNQAITEAKDAGLTGSDKWGYAGRAAAIEGSIAGGFQLAGIGGFEKMITGGMGMTRAGLKGFMKSTGVAMLQEVPEEVITEILDEYNQIVSGVSPNEMTPKLAWEIIKKTTVQTLMTVGASGGIRATISQDALKNRDAFIDGLMDSNGLDRRSAEGVFERATKSKDEFTVALGRELEQEHTLTAEGLEEWVATHKDEATTLAGIERPSRKDFEKAGLPRRDGKVRARVAGDVAELVNLVNEEGNSESQTDDDTTGAPPDLSPTVGTDQDQASEGRKDDPVSNDTRDTEVKPGEQPSTGAPSQPKTEGVEKKRVSNDTRDTEAKPGPEKAEASQDDDGGDDTRTDLPASQDRKTSETKLKRRIDPESFRPEDGQPINPGDTFETLSGRETTPYPKTSKRMHKGDVAKENQWLIENAVAEAESRGDDFNLTQFKGEDAKNLPPASISALNAYLFESQPDVQKKLLKTLVKPGAKPNEGRPSVKPDESNNSSSSNAVGTDAVKGLSDDDIDSLVSELENEQGESSKPKPATKPQPKKKIGQKGVTKKPAPAPKSEAPAVDHGSPELNSAAAALANIFNSAGEELGFAAKATREFQESVYSKVKPHFDNAFKAKGEDFREFTKWVMSLDLGDVRPYLKRFRDDLAAGDKPKPPIPPKNDSPPSNFEKSAREIILSGETALQKNGAMKQLAKKHGITEKAAQERVESVLVDIARDIAQNDKLSERDRFDALIELYDSQPRFSKRTSTSIKNQAYSTPTPLAFAVNIMADVTGRDSVYEPTAGHGALTLLADPEMTHVNELDSKRVSELQNKGFGEVTSEDATTYLPEGQYDKVIANPPFGALESPYRKDGFNLKKLEHQIAVQALEAMKDNGSAAFILGAAREEGKITESDRIFLNYLMNNYNVTANFELSGDLYRNQGASFPVRVIAVTGRKESTGMQKLSPDSVNRVETWDKVWDTITEARNEARKIRQDLEPKLGGRGDSDDSSGGDARTDNSGSSSGASGANGPTSGTGGGGGRRGGRGAVGGSGSSSGKSDAGGRTRSDGGKVEPGPSAENDSGENDGSVRGSGLETQGGDSTLSGKGDSRSETGGRGDDGKFKSGNLDGNDSVEVRKGREATDRQHYYDAQSKSKSLKTLINKFLSPGTFKALTNLEARVGNIDDWVAGKLGYDSVSEMHKGLAAEQVDGVALAIEKIESGSALIIGDQTGIGKGRQAAALIRYAKQRGWVPVFVTKDPKLFSDMYGDAQAIGETMNPLILGNKDKSNIKDDDGNVIIPAMSEAKQKTATIGLSGGEAFADTEYDSIFLPYSQLKDLEKDTGAPNPRHNFLLHMAQNEKVMFVLDESHDGAGETSTTGFFLRGGEKTQKVGGKWMKLSFPGVLNSPGVMGTTYLSATYAKRPDTMPLYFKTSLGKAVRSTENLIKIFKRGGIALQQSVANALAEAGEYVRRERDFSGVQFHTKTVARETEGKQDLVKRMDSVTDVLREIVEFSKSFAAAIKNNPDLVPTVNEKVLLESNDFSSVLHNYIGQVLLALKVDSAVAEAVAAHGRGEKPVITLSGTMESFLKEFISNNGLNVGDTVDLSYRDVLNRALDRTMRVSEKDAGGNKTAHQLTAAMVGLQDEYNVIVDMIQELDNDIPVSPIDAIHAGLRKAGLTSGELTGRESIIEYQEDGTAIFQKRPANDRNDKNKHVNAFNRGDTDALILNRSGSTGLSIHASKEFKDQKPRHMIVVQADLDINVFTQTLGRILRTGMAGDASTHAKYTLLSLPVEAERRTSTVLAAKMKGLNANTTADSDGDTAFDTLDFLNKYGDEVVSQILAEDDALSFDVGLYAELDQETGEARTKPDIARKLTGRMAVLPNARQQEVYKQVAEAYRDRIQELKDSGEYDLEISVQESWDAELKSETVLEKGEDESSMFTASLVQKEYSIKDPRKVPKPDDVRTALKDRFGSENPNEAAAALKEEMQGLLKTLEAQEREYVGEEPKLIEGNKASERRHSLWKARKMRADDGKQKVTGHLKNLLRASRGKVYFAQNDEAVGLEGFVTDFSYKEGDGNPYRLSRFKVGLIVESRSRKRSFNLSALAGKATFTSVDGTVDGFAENMSDNERVNRTVLTGNLVKAVETAETGMITTFRTSEGETVTGLVMPEGWKSSDMASDPRMNVTTGDAAISLLNQGTGVNIIGTDISIGNGQRGYVIFVPKSKQKGAKYYLDDALTAIVGDFESSGSKMTAKELPAGVISRAVEYLVNQKKVRLSAVGTDIETVAGAHGRTPGETMNFPAPSQPSAMAAERGRGGMVQDRVSDEDGEVEGGVTAGDIVRAVKRLWPGLSVRGKATFKRKAPGWYNTRLGEIRTQDVRNIDVILHELGHHFDRQLGMWSRTNGLPTGVASELMNLGRDMYGNSRPAGGYRVEGFAEFIRHYMTGADAATIAPRLYKWFNTEYLAKNPQEAKKLQKLQDLVTQLRSQSPQATVRAFRSKPKVDWSNSRALVKAGRWIDTKIRDINLTIVHAMKSAGIDIDALSPEQNPYMLATAYSMSASGKARHAALQETTDLAGNRTGSGLREILAPLAIEGQEEIDNWIDYTVALRALSLHERGINPGISMQDAQAVVAKFDSRAGFKETVKEVTDWSRRNMRLLVEAGMMTEKELTQIEEKNPVYVPFQRRFDKGEIAAGRGGNSSKGVWRIKGSGREIHDPIDALIMQAGQMTAAAMQADVVRSMVNLYDSHQGSEGQLAKLMSEVPAPLEATTFTSEQIKKEMAEKAIEMGADPDAVIAAMMETWEDKLTVFTKSDTYKGKDNIVSVIVDGRRRFFEVNPDMYKLLSGLNRGAVIPGVIGKVLRGATKFQRLGATGLNPGFGLIRNLIRDAATFSITNDYAKGGPIGALHGLYSEATNEEMANRYDSMGVALSGWIGHNFKGARALRQKVTAGTTGRKVIVTASHPVEVFSNLFGFTESGPRMAEFIGAIEYARENGYSEKSAAILAAVAGKDATVNFTRAGEYSRFVNEVVLFFNAGVQSIDKGVRTVKDAPGRTALRGLGYITLVAAMNYMRNRDEEWWKELPTYEKWQFIHIQVPGSDTIIRIPLPFEFGILFGALPIAEVEDTRNPGAFSEAVEQLSQVVAPSLMPALLKPIMEVWRNKDFKGSPIVPDNIQRSRLPKDQYTTHTTDLAVMAGKIFGQSPAKIEHLVNGYTGGLYKRVSSAYEKAIDPASIGAEGLSNLPVAGTLFLRSGTSRLAGDYYDRLDTLRQKKGSGESSLVEIGELAEAERLNRKLQGMWAERRSVIAEEKDAKKRATMADEMLKDIYSEIREHNKADKEHFRKQGAGVTIYDATNPNADESDREEARELLSGMSREEQIAALETIVRQRGGKTQTRKSNGRLTAYGLRRARLLSLGVE